MGNVESVSKKFKNFSFFDENWQEKYFWQKLSQHVAQLNGVPSINAKKKFWQFEASVKTRLKNIPFAL